MLSSGETLHVVKTGMFPAPSHVPRTLGVKVEWLREVFHPPEYRLYYQPESGQCSDIFMKSTFSVASWRHSCDLIGIIPCEVMSSGRGGGNAPQARIERIRAMVEPGHFRSGSKKMGHQAPYETATIPTLHRSPPTPPAPPRLLP